MSNLDSIQQEISHLPREKQWYLLQYLLQQFSPGSNKQSQTISWSAAYGLGKEVWKGIDAQQYIDELRSER